MTIEFLQCLIPMLPIFSRGMLKKYSRVFFKKKITQNPLLENNFILMIVY